VAQLHLLKATALLALSVSWIAFASAQGDAGRGEYLSKIGGCLACHTADTQGAAPYAGGRPLKTPFGTFYGPNITPHPKAGIGGWTETDFIRAMRHGRRPDDANYFPAFPYPSFTSIAEGDLRDLWAYLRTLSPSSRANREHELSFVFKWRPLVTIWKWLFFTSGVRVGIDGASDLANRGAYLVRALGHCSECHTPRNFLGGPIRERFLGGTKGVPNLTPTNLKTWSDAGLKEFFQTGVTPDGDATAVAMEEVVRNTTSQLNAKDLQALIAYLRALPALPNAPQSKAVSGK
jgi:mono/diheme cytochrome c family protein